MARAVCRRLTATSPRLCTIRDQANLSYLAASKDAEPIYLNRHLCEADVIIPISLSRPRRSLGYTGLHGGLYPVFADEAARGRFRAPSSATEAVERRRRRTEADEVGWLLGVQLIVQIVPGRAIPCCTPWRGRWRRWRGGD